MLLRVIYFLNGIVVVKLGKGLFSPRLVNCQKLPALYQQPRFMEWVQGWQDSVTRRGTGCVRRGIKKVVWGTLCPNMGRESIVSETNH